MSNLKDYIIAALLIAILVILATRKPTPAPDYSQKYDSLKTVVDNSYQRIAEEERKKLQKSAEIVRLNRIVTRLSKEKAKTVQTYRQEIKRLRGLKTAQVDSLLLERYGNPPDSRKILTEIEEGRQYKALESLARLEISHLNGVIENQQGIIKSDSLHIQEFKKVILANESRHELNKKETEKLKSQLKKLRTTNTLLKIALPIGIIIGLLAPS